MPTSPFSTDEFNRLESACRNLAASSVQDEEAEAARSPILILMSTVLSLNRRWYSHALPARRHFGMGSATVPVALFGVTPNSRSGRFHSPFRALAQVLPARRRDADENGRDDGAPQLQLRGSG